jgi:hypothetical protein
MAGLCLFLAPDMVVTRLWPFYAGACPQNPKQSGPQCSGPKPMNRRQFRIELADVPNDRQTVESIFLSVAKKFGFFDNTITSRIPDTIKSVVEREGYGFGFGARIVGNSIIVDMFPNNSPAEELYAGVCKYIEVRLIQLFNNRICEVSEKEFIPTH